MRIILVRRLFTRRVRAKAEIDRLFLKILNELRVNTHLKVSSLDHPSAEGLLSVGLSADFVPLAVKLYQEFSSERKIYNCLYPIHCGNVVKKFVCGLKAEMRLLRR